MFQLSVTLTTGETLAFEAAKMPRHWKSWVMQQCPYGTTFQGCTFARSTSC